MSEEKHTQENLTGMQALEKIRAIVDDAKTCFFCTEIRTGVPNVSTSNDSARS